MRAWTAILAFALCACAARAATVRELPNGARVVGVHTSASDHFACAVLVTCDARDEVGHPGVRAVLAQIAFSATETADAAAALERARLLDDLGGQVNAQPWDDFIALSAMGGPEAMDVGLRMLGDAIRAPVYPEGAIEVARRNLRPQVERMSSDPVYGLLNRVEGSLFPDRDEWRPLGTVDALAAVDSAQLTESHRAWFVGPRLVAVLLAPLDEAAAADRAAELVKDAPGGATATSAWAPPAAGPSIVTEDPAARAAWMAVSFPVPNVSSADWPVVRVIDELLGGQSGLLMRDARLRQLAPAPRTILMPRSGDSSLTVLAGSPLPWRIEMLRQELWSVIGDLGTKTLPAADLDAAKKRLLGQTACEVRAPARRALDIAWAVQSGRDPGQAAQDPLGPVRAVSPDDVKRVAAEWLVPEKAGLGLVLPVARRDARDRMEASLGG